MKKCESVPSCPWRAWKCSTLPMEVVEVFHSACGGHGSVVKGLEVFHIAWESSTLPVEGKGVFHAAGGGGGGVSRCGGVPHCP